MKRFSITKRFWSRVRREVAREAREHMISYAAARQSFDIYEMRLETIETRLIRKIVALERELEALKGMRDDAVQPLRRAIGE